METFGQFIGWVAVTIIACGASAGAYAALMFSAGKETGLILIVAAALWWLSFSISPFQLVVQ